MKSYPQVGNMNEILDRAVRKAVDNFPFPHYMTKNDKPKEVYYSIGRTVMRHMAQGVRILDFGCGPCDKTAVLQFLGYTCTGYDDLQDYWHMLPGNRERIVDFASRCGIDLVVAAGGGLPFQAESFDMILLQDVLEHWHDSPRDLLNDLLQLAKPGGYLLITVPNAVNIRKRTRVVLGKSNLPPFDQFYWWPSRWRGHVREYVRDDLVKLGGYLDLEIVELRGCDHMLEKVPLRLKLIYVAVTNVFDGLKDSWLLVARKPSGWKPIRTPPPDKLNSLAHVWSHNGAH
jgi:SAM-dependent methyltransferase